MAKDYCILDFQVTMESSHLDASVGEGSEGSWGGGLREGVKHRGEEEGNNYFRGV